MPRDLTRTKPVDEEHPGGTEEFAGRRTRATKEVPNQVQSGWSSDRRPVVKGDRPTQFKVPDDGEEVVIAFLQDSPFASFFQHWVKIEKGQRKPYKCLETDDCPLCARGDRPKSQDWFNVAVIVNAEESDKGVELPHIALWYGTADPTEKIKDRADNKRYSPINRDGLYFAVSKRAGKNGFNTYSVDPVKEEELSDWGVEPLSDVARKELLENMYTADLVKVNTKTELQDVADTYFDD